jgi:hypothetical protein
MRMFFSRRCRHGIAPATRLQNQQPGGNQGVLYKIADPALFITLALPLTIAGNRLGVVLPVCLLIFGMCLSPFPAAVTDHLCVLRIAPPLVPAILIATPVLAWRLAADRLIGAAWGGQEK